jgi:hypothetical protein
MKTMNRGIRLVFGSLLLSLLLLGAFTPATAQHADGPIPQFFHTSDQCIGCHNNLAGPDGEDVSIGFSWRSSMMGNAARDPYWMAGVRRESIDHPAVVDVIEDKCTVCHLPIARTTSVAMGGQGRAFENFPGIGEGGPHTVAALDGVSCNTCHQIQNENLGTREGFTGGYVIDVTTPMGERDVIGPFDVDPGRSRVMHSASEFRPVKASYIQSAEFCANCHTLFTHALDADGNDAGELPEQTPYLEWKESSYRGQQTCQDCHMPEVDGEVSVTGVLPNPRSNVNRHVFRGGNFLMPRILNKHRNQMQVAALPQELEATARSAEENLANHAARVKVTRLAMEDGLLNMDVAVSNLAGHKLPSAYPSRRAWLHVTISDGAGNTLFESGAFKADGFIEGNDNDLDASSYEPHHDLITGGDQVQIYEDIMVDYAGEVTTGLLYGAKYIKDNRLLPQGFNKATASPDVEVHGSAEGDVDFIGGSDLVRYAVEVGSAQGPFKATVEFWYQPIGFRWAMNLADYDSQESAQFLEMYRGMSSATSALMARTEGRLK